MGMYDNLNRIEKAIESNRKQEELKETRATQEQKIKYDLLSLLETEIIEAKNSGFDLYNINTKDRIIENIMKNNATTYLHGKDFTRFFLANNYYKTIKQINNTQKEAERPAKEHEKEDLQKQKIQLQMEILKQREKERQQKQIEKEQKEQQKQIEKQEKEEQKQLIIQQQQKAIYFSRILQTIFYIIIAPVLIIGGFLIACAKEAGRTGGTRR